MCMCVCVTSGVCTDPVTDGNDGSDRFSDLDSINQCLYD